MKASDKIRKATRTKTQDLLSHAIHENKKLRKEISRLQVIIARYQIRLGKAGIHFKQLHKLLREHKPN